MRNKRTCLIIVTNSYSHKLKRNWHKIAQIAESKKYFVSRVFPALAEFQRVARAILFGPGTDVTHSIRRSSDHRNLNFGLPGFGFEA